MTMTVLAAFSCWIVIGVVFCTILQLFAGPLSSSLEVLLCVVAWPLLLVCLGATFVWEGVLRICSRFKR
jgi:hypothetical protein